MHILVTNDDGPPSPESSPYVHCLVQHLQLAGHVVSVCLPHTQRSWIGKAHMIGQTLKPFYYRPGSRVHGDAAEATTHLRPSPAADVEEWILIDGTPASCVQIGLYHFFHDRGPVDLVVSGPNYGRNTSSVFALSSGTLGAALEAAVCRRKSIALSFAFFSRNHDPVIIEGACRHSVRLIEALYGQWPADGSADLYSVNVPLVEGVETHKTLWTDMLQNYWMDGSCFQEVEGNATDAAEEEVLIREGPGGEVDDVPTTTATSSSSDKPRAGHVHKHFKWAPRLADVYKSVADSDPGNDGRTVREGNTSITPLKANFAQGDGAFSRKEFVLPNIPGESDVTMADLAIRDGVLPPRGSPVRAIVAYAAGDDDDDYVQPLIIHALKTLFPGGCLDLVTGLQASVDCFSLPEMLVHPDSKVLQISSYEAIDFQFATVHSQSCLVNSYMIRKALIRKHYLSATVDHWVAKKPESPLSRHVKRSEAFELDYAEFLKDALVEAFDLRESMERNAALGRADQGAAREWWILKPGMSDRGHGIRLFSTMDELQAIFDVWDADLSANDDDDNSVATEDGDGGDRADGIMTSHLRHFVAQPYIHPPLLLGGEGARKFHIRTYVLATGCLSVHVYRPMLALFASSPYLAPWAHAGDAIDTFLTNTCLHEKHQNRGRDGQEERPSGGDDDSRVRRFWDLPLPRNMLDAVFAHICHVTGELFEAAATTMPVHFQTLPNAFEVFGMDFLLDERAVPWLLEVNAFPDFKQTGPHLQNLVDGFWRGVVREAVLPFFALPAAAATGPDEQGDMVLVKKIDLGRRS